MLSYYLIVFNLIGSDYFSCWNYEMTCEVCRNAHTQYQPCAAQNCNLTCNGPYCEQVCSANKYTLECDGNRCKQTCSGFDCTLKCYAKHCDQTCSSSECALECDRISQTCDQICNGGSCIKDTIASSATSTMETATSEVSTTASRHFHTCEPSYAGE